MRAAVAGLGLVALVAVCFWVDRGSQTFRRALGDYVPTPPTRPVRAAGNGWLRRWTGPNASRLDADRIGGFGYSNGGALIARAAAADPRIRALVLVATYTNWTDQLHHRFRRRLPGIGYFVVGAGVDRRLAQVHTRSADGWPDGIRAGRG